jgi:myo-inositol-1(or 4)-monophosphatase
MTSVSTSYDSPGGRITEDRLESLAAHVGEHPLLDIVLCGLEAALAAGHLLRSLYGNSHEITYKGRIDLVTEADVASEKTILEILQRGSGLPVMAEESGSSSGTDSDLVWIVDPLDGTTNFAHGFQVFAVSIALASRKDKVLVPEVGVVYCPMQDELFWGVKGAGAWLETAPLSVSSETDFSRSLIGTGFPYAIEKHADYVMKTLGKIIVKAQGIRRAGAAAVDLAWVAAGRLDGFYEIGLKPWDTAAGVLLVREAGGRVTDFAGREFHPEMSQTLATNGLVHNDLASFM